MVSDEVFENVDGLQNLSDHCNCFQFSPFHILHFVFILYFLTEVVLEEVFENVDGRQNLSDLEQRSKNDLTLTVSNIASFIWSFSLLCIPNSKPR